MFPKAELEGSAGTRCGDGELAVVSENGHVLLLRRQSSKGEAPRASRGRTVPVR